jgi:uncharacterized protein involved in exopolysaccharide biosynthesis
MNTNEIQQPFQEEEEFGIKDLIRIFKTWKEVFVKNIFKILFAGIIGGAIGFAYAYLDTPKYNAQLKFVMRSDPGGGLSSGLAGLSSLLGSGTGAGGSGSGLERVIELIGSDRIIGNAILSEAEVNGKQDLLVNHYITLQGYRKAWEKDSLLSEVNFPLGVQFADLNFPQRKAIKTIIGSLIGKDNSSKIIGKSFDKKSGVVTLAVTYKNEDFSILLTNAIYKEVIEFYSDQSLAATSNNVQVLNKKADSIRRELDATRRAFAKNSDQALGLLLQEDKVENKSLSFKESMLSLMYAEVQKNLETLKYIEASSMPSFSIIDQPYSPIRPIKRSIIIYIFLGFISLFSIVLVFLYLRTKISFSDLFKD